MSPARSTIVSVPVPRSLPVWLAAAVITLAGLGVYWGTLDAPFVFDDIPAITMNESIRDLSRLDRVLMPPADGPVVGGRPLVNLSFAINFAISGWNPRGYHLTNLALHVLAALVLFDLVRRLFARPGMPDRLRAAALPAAFVTALLWTVHPLQSETVICTVQRTEGLVSLFYLVAVLGLLRAASDESSRRWFIVAGLACLAGMATKEVMVTAPVLLVLFDRTFLADSWRETWRRRGRWHFVFAATWILLAGLLFQAGGHRGTSAGFGLSASPWTYLLTQARAITTYLKLTFWPHPLVVDYGAWTAGGIADVAPELLLIAALVIATGVALWRWPRIGFAGAWFFGVLAPSSSIVPLISQTIAEHRVYLPLAGLLALLVAGGFLWSRTVTLTAGCALAVGAGFLTVRRGNDYASDITLWRQTAQYAPSNPWAHYHLGDAHLMRQEFEPAAAAFQDSLAVGPGNTYAQAKLGMALTKLGRPEDALPHLKRAIQLRPDYPGAHFRLGEAWLALGKAEKAIPCFAEAVQLAPDYGDAEGNWGVALFQLQRYEEALPHFERAATLLPRSALARLNLGLVCAQLGRVAAAREHFNAALVLDPEFAPAWKMLEQFPAPGSGH